MLLAQWETICRFSFTVHPIGLDAVALRIDFHLRCAIVKFHVLLANNSTAAHWLDPLLQIVIGHCPRSNARLADKCNAGLRH